MNKKTSVIIAGLATGLGAAGAEAAAPGNAHMYESAAAAVSNYVELRRGWASPDTLAKIIDPVWTGRYIRSDASAALDAAHISDMPAMFDAPQLTSLQIFYDDFAVARLDQRPEPGAAIVTMFRTSDGWRVATEAVAVGDCVVRAGHYRTDIAADDVLAVLGQYYSAVDTDDPRPLQSAHHTSWRMKNHEGDAIVSETPEVFAARLGGGKHKGYALDRQIADLQIIYNCMAIVRIDKPSSKGVTVFTLYRQNDGWVIVDKAWSQEK